MNRLTFIFLILLISACASAQSTPVIEPTATPSAVKKTPTPKPSNTPEPTATPTETPDPNRPLDATDTDVEGNYTKIDKVTGETLTWSPIQYGADAENGIKGHWFKSQMKNGEDILLYDSTLSSFVGPNSDSIPFHQYMLTNNGQLKVGYVLSHPNQVAEFGPGTPLDGYSQSSSIFTYLAVRVFGKQKPSEITQEDWGKYEILFKNGLMVPVGSDFWNTSKGYDEYIVDYNLAESDPSFMKTTGEKAEFYWKYYIQDGKLVVLILQRKVEGKKAG